MPVPKGQAHMQKTQKANHNIESVYLLDLLQFTTNLNRSLPTLSVGDSRPQAKIGRKPNTQRKSFINSIAKMQKR
eukprot:3336146-Amphidinium_carterae.1